MNKKIIALIIILFVLVFVAMFLISLIGRNENPTPLVPTPPISLPTAILSPTPASNELIATSVLPSEDNTYLPFQKITVVFNDAVLPQNISIETTPSTEVDVFQGLSPNEILIIPKTVWPNGLTTLVFLQSTSSVSGKRLRAPLTHTISTALPTLSQEELEDVHP